MQAANASQAYLKNRTPSPFHGPQWPHLASRGVYTSVAVLMGVVVVSATLVNGLVIAVSIRFKKLRSPLNYILVNLASADLLVTFFGSTISFTNNTFGFFVFGKTVCQFEGFMVSLTGKADQHNGRVYTEVWGENCQYYFHFGFEQWGIEIRVPDLD
uniref:Uncharacterized protein n=1 Tax=Sphaerodactylus townsendi TaxID=933632 RepID=A0ACB8ECL6_9SAUR